MEKVLLVIHLMIVASMIGVIMLQKSDGGGLGSMGGGSGGMGDLFSSRGQANAFTRITAMLATGFFAMSLLLAVVLAGGAGGSGSLIEGLSPSEPAPIEEPVDQPTGPTVPLD